MVSPRSRRKDAVDLYHWQHPSHTKIEEKRLPTNCRTYLSYLYTGKTSPKKATLRDVRLLIWPQWRRQTGSQLKTWATTLNIHGFALDGKSYQQRWATALTLIESAISYVGITTSISRTCNLIITPCGRWSVVNN